MWNNSVWAYFDDDDGKLFFLGSWLFILFKNVIFQEHLDYEIVQSLNPEFNKAVVRVNVFKEHRQTIQVTAFLPFQFLFLAVVFASVSILSMFILCDISLSWWVFLSGSSLGSDFLKIPPLFQGITCRLQSSLVGFSQNKSKGRWGEQFRKSF